MENEIISKVVTITPELAEEWLKRNTHNRPVHKVHLARLIKTMLDGKWKLNGQNIIFDKDDVLIDGQHRLMASVASGVTIRSSVCWGVDRDAFATIDTGDGRTHADTLAVERVPNYARVSGVITSLEEIRTNNPHKKYTNCAILDLYNSNPNTYYIYGAIANNLRQKVKSFPIKPVFVCAVWMHLVEDLGYPQEIADKFFYQLVSYNTASIPVVDALRVKFLGMIGDKVSAPLQSYKVNLLYKAWNYYVTGKGDTKRFGYDPDKEDNIELLPYTSNPLKL